MTSNADIKAFYETFPYPSTLPYTLDGKIKPEIKSYLTVGTPGMRILCGGCGTCEPVLIYNGNNRCMEIVGVDLSQASLDICQQYIDKLPHKAPIRLICEDLLTHKGEKPYDVITLTGVMHHVRNVDALLQNMRKNLASSGMLAGFVYPKVGREHIIDQHAEFVNLPKSVEGVKLVKDHLSRLHPSNPSRKWFNTFLQEDEEVADTWLHPYFVHYDFDSLTEVLNRNGFEITDYTETTIKILFAAKPVNTSVSSSEVLHDTNYPSRI